MSVFLPYPPTPVAPQWSDAPHGALDRQALVEIVHDLKQARRDWRKRQQRTETGGRELPSREAVREILNALRGVLFPMRLGPVDLRAETEDFYVGYQLDTALTALLQQVQLTLRYQVRLQSRQAPPDHVPIDAHARHIVQQLASQLPGIRRTLDEDIEAAYAGDPAASSVDEVLLSYPGVQAVIAYRLAHALYRLGAPLLARVISELAHAETGIDIHPGAQIGSGFFIDHGTGVVIGETTRIGQRVRLYQAVTLGAKRFEVDSEGRLQKDYPRHPVVEDDVVIYAGATILGRITIGQGSIIGGNVWLTRSVPPNSQVTQALIQQDTLIQPGPTPQSPPESPQDPVPAPPLDLPVG